MSEETDKPTENPLRTSGVELTDKNGGDEGEVEVKKVFKKKKYFAGFKPYEESTRFANNSKSKNRDGPWYFR